MHGCKRATHAWKGTPPRGLSVQVGGGPATAGPALGIQREQGHRTLSTGKATSAGRGARPTGAGQGTVGVGLGAAARPAGTDCRGHSAPAWTTQDGGRALQAREGAERWSVSRTGGTWAGQGGCAERMRGRDLRAPRPHAVEATRQSPSRRGRPAGPGLGAEGGTGGHGAAGLGTFRDTERDRWWVGAELRWGGAWGRETSRVGVGREGDRDPEDRLPWENEST